MFTKDCIVFDHRDRKPFIFSARSSPTIRTLLKVPAQCRKDQRYPRPHRDACREKTGVREIPGGRVPEIRGKFTKSVSKEAFEKSVERVKEHIAAGDIFQGALAGIECRVDHDPFAIYAALREINPSPYMYYLDFGDEKVIGASPEMLVRVEKRRVTTVPIAGTRPRGKDTPRTNGWPRNSA